MRLTERYILFWSGVFGNFHPCTIAYDGYLFSSSEQLFMYLKAQTFGDKQCAKLIAATTTPKEAKALGQSVKNFDEDIWRGRREVCMEVALYEKFSQNSDLKAELISEAYIDKQFVEASPYDIVWGIGLSEDDPDADNSEMWRGENLLGKCLDRVRKRVMW